MHMHMHMHMHIHMHMQPRRGLDAHAPPPRTPVHTPSPRPFTPLSPRPFTPPSPRRLTQVLGPLHLLWVNLVTDGPPATALGFNPPDPNNMRRPPRGKNDPLVSPFTMVRYALTGTYVGAATVGAFLYQYHQMGIPWSAVRTWTSCTTWEEGALKGFEAACDAFDPAKGKLLASSVALTTLVAMEMLRALCSVSDSESLLQKPPWANRWLLAGVTMPALLHLAVLYTPQLAKIFVLAPLSKADWYTVAAFAGPLVLLEECLKLGARCMRTD